MQETSQPDKGDGVIRLTDVNNPTLALYLPENTDAPLPVVLVFPGGGYNILAMNKEGTEIAAWFNSIGVAAAVVKYRVPKNRGWRVPGCPTRRASGTAVCSSMAP